MVIMTPSTIMPPPTCDKKLTFKISHWQCRKGHFGAYLIPSWPWPMTPKFDAFILAPKPVSGESLVKFRE